MLIYQNLQYFSMNLLRRLLCIMILLFVFQTGIVFAQVVGVNIVAHGVLALVGGSREKKLEKVIEKSSTQEKISGLNVTVLRVKESDIKSKAKNHIIALQNRLTEYNTQYKNNQPLIVTKNDIDLMAIQDIDENWPTDEYASELRAYKRYASQQKQKPAAASGDSLHTTPAGPVKKDSTSVKL